MNIELQFVLTKDWGAVEYSNRVDCPCEFGVCGWLDWLAALLLSTPVIGVNEMVQKVHTFTSVLQELVEMVR